ncbi:hypothetical protein A4U49_01395 [Acidithiobacillus ferrivorans]|nr:hypothetical protein A4U49_01395 [Acidithiobacillus ferrivorans]
MIATGRRSPDGAFYFPRLPAHLCSHGGMQRQPGITLVPGSGGVRDPLVGNLASVFPDFGGGGLSRGSAITQYLL